MEHIDTVRISERAHEGTSTRPLLTIVRLNHDDWDLSGVVQPLSPTQMCGLAAEPEHGIAAAA